VISLCGHREEIPLSIHLLASKDGIDEDIDEYLVITLFSYSLTHSLILCLSVSFSVCMEFVSSLLGH
jgi:hypothetical protein